MGSSRAKHWAFMVAIAVLWIPVPLFAATPVFTVPDTPSGKTHTINETVVIGTLIETLSATDAGNGVIEFSIQTQTPSTPSKFAIDNGVKLVTTASFDYETEASKSYVLYIIATSNAAASGTATATVTVSVANVNDNRPVFSSDIYFASIAENTASGSEVVQFTVTDADGSAITTAITSGDDPTAKFVDNGNVIRTTTTSVDYEALRDSNYRYKLTLVATDGELAATATVIVTITSVNEAAPVFQTAVFSPAYTSATTPYNIPEDAAVGTTVVKVTATDTDDGVDGQIIFTIGSVTKSTGGTVDEIFHIDKVSGVLTTITNTLDSDNGLQYYDVIIIASDQGATKRTASITVRVGITEVNDNTPAFSQNVYTKSIVETLTVGSSVTEVTATDGDITPAILVYSLETSSSPDTYSAKFEFDTTLRNKINLKGVIDLDNNEASTYNLVVKVSDGSRSSTATVLVTVTTVNEFTPVITGGTTFNVGESAAVNALIATFQASDNDTGIDGEISFSISDNSDGNFILDKNSGKLRLAKSLDFETKKIYSLTIQAADSATANQKTAESVITINVQDVSDELPTCSSYYYYRTVLETVSLSTLVETIACTDADAVDTLSFTIEPSTNPANHFAINNNTGAITVSSVLDYDTGDKHFELNVKVTDGKTSLAIPVVIDVTHVNEYTPTFTAGQVANVLENEAVGKSLFKFTASDNDTAPDNIVSYEITSTLDKFSIDQSSGAIHLIEELDFENTKQYVIEVLARDGANAEGRGSITVNVTNVNDVRPSCTPTYHVISIPENTTLNYTLVSNFNCVDADSSTLTYNITSQSPVNRFSIDDAGATPKLVLSAALDYETHASYNLKITVSDGQLSTIIDVDISVTDVNEGGPQFQLDPYAANITESTSSIGDVVVTVVATDPDLATSKYGKLTYSIISGNTGNKFLLDSSSGKIILSGTLDRETNPSYSLKVRVSEEEGGGTDTADVTITVLGANDNTPTCISAMSFTKSFAEPGNANDILFTFNCSDADGDNLNYVITTNGALTYFQIVGTHLQLRAPIDYETVTQTEFNLVIEISDGTNKIEVNGNVIVRPVNEHTPVFTPATYAVIKLEDLDLGSEIITVTATDADRGETVRYSWVTTPVGFTLDQSTGQVLLAGTLDRETQTLYSLQIRASDGTNNANTTVTLTVQDVNDNMPVFNPKTYSKSITEGGLANEAVVTVVATDVDDPGTNNYGTVAYSFSETYTQFTINSATGEIKTNGPLDYETATSHSLKVVAVDSNGLTGSKSSTAVVTVIVTPVNELDPVFINPSYTFSVNENTAIGTSVGTVEARDADNGVDGQIKYSMTAHIYFSIDLTTGVISVKAALDHEIVTQHSLTVIASDSNTTPRSVSVAVTVHVNDVNDNKPACSPIFQAVFVNEDSAIDYTVATLTCSDADKTSPNKDLEYTIITVNGVGSTVFSNINNVLKLNSALDYELTTSYVINIKVADKGATSLSTTATVKVDVRDINEQTPVFTGAPSISFTISETIPSGSSVYQLTASDADTQQTIKYSFNPTSTQFSIDPDNGKIYLITILDFDTLVPPTIQVKAFATDSGTNPVAKSSSVDITITIANANDVSPIFFPAVYSASVSEHLGIGTSITKVTATDNDTAVLTYTLNNSSVFAIGADGLITVQNPILDYETTKSYALIAYAVDAATHTASTTVHIKVTGYNENAPVFATSSQTVQVNENASINTLVVTAAATDSDHGPDGAITYSISAFPTGFHNVMSINPSTGEMLVVGDLDREGMTTNPVSFTILAKDAGTNPDSKSATFSLTLNVLDVNDNAPTCPSSLYSSSIPENSAPGVAVVTLACSDADATATNNILTYSFVLGNDGAGQFAIGSTTGAVTVAAGAVLDRETTPTYKVLIAVRDGGGLATTATLTVLLSDVNDKTPTFNPATFAFDISENVAINTLVGTVTATDDDTGLAGSFEYTIFSGNTDSKFSIDANTGQIRIVKALDFETKSTYQLTLHAIDRDPTTKLTGNTTVDINVKDENDVRPTCAPTLQTISMPENSPISTNIGFVNCTDSDSGNGGVLSYAIVSVNGVATTTPFIIDATGKLDLNTASLDYETEKLKKVGIVVTDRGTPALSGTATINVVITDFNEYTPVFTNTPYNVAVLESTTIGASLAVIKATDVDTDDTVIYSLNPASSVFGIDAVTGILYLSGLLDRETVSVYSLTVNAVDNGGKSSSAGITITVNNINDGVPVFSPAVYIATINENDAFGTLVTTVTAYDSDTDNTTLAYSINSGNGDSVFRIENSGKIVVNNVVNLNYDSNVKSYSLVVHCSDTSNIATATVVISVSNYNDHAPSFGSDTSSTKHIPENSLSGTSIVTVAATDADHGNDGKITYFITAGNAANLFAVHPTSGEVTLVGQSLNAEGTTSYTITITARDGGTNPNSLSADYILTVNIDDVNDMTPVCNPSLYSATISELAQTDVSVVQLTCTDGDKTSPNKDITTYIISSGNTGGAFKISDTGLITTQIILDREMTPSYTMVVRVMDGGTTALIGSTTVVVVVSDENDEPPRFTAASYEATVAENKGIGSSLIKVTATDPDQGNAGKVVYSIFAGNTNNRFEIDSSSGDLILVNAIDYDTMGTNKVYTLTVRATDSGTTSLTDDVTVSLTVTDFNDNKPSCSPVLKSLEIPESTSGSTAVFTFPCTDADSGINKLLTFSIESINGNAASTIFIVDANAGTVSTAATTVLNFEDVSSYNILINVKDGGTPSLSSTLTLNVDLIDVNEFNPVFQGNPYRHNVPETTAVGASVYRIQASDADSSQTVTYKINPSNTYFEMDAVTGNIYTIQAIDYDSLASKLINFTVVATDNGATPNSTSETVSFTVTNFNDGVPVFNPGVYSAVLPENTAATHTVLQLNVADIDDTVFTYSILSGNTDNCFTVDTTGKLLLADTSNFDYDTKATGYLLVVQASDPGNNKGTASVAIEVSSYNDFTPVLNTATQTVSVSEDGAIGHVIDTVQATDGDKGSDGAITYSIFSVTNNGSGKFVLNPTTGVVTLSASLDRETQSLYEITVLAADAGKTPAAKTATYSLTVSVTDVNDLYPSCTQMVYVSTIPEDSSMSTSVAQLTCSDGDATGNNISGYSISSGNTGNHFIVLGTGQVNVLMGTLDREAQATHTLKIDVRDSGTPSKTSTVTLSVFLSDTNDNSPTFDNNYVMTVSENAVIGTVIGTVLATDADVGVNADLTYSITQGNVGSKFQVDPTSGAVKMIASLDREELSQYDLTVTATDNGVTKRSGTSTVRITVEDVNDNSPECLMLQTLILSENKVPSGISILDIGANCSDGDNGVNAQLSYSIFSVNGVTNNDPFSISASTGQLSLQANLDFETIQSYAVLVYVKDGGSPQLTSTVTVEVQITDVNEHSPQFRSTPYSANVREDKIVGTSVFQVSATDGDADSIKFSIDPPMDEFEIDPNSGILYLTQTVDYDTVTGPLIIVIVATDDGTVPGKRSSTATVTFTVTDFNDGTPEFHPGVYAVQLSESATVGSTVVILTITDIDSTAFTYNIEAGNGENIFEVTGTGKTAVISVVDRTNLDYEGTKEFSLVVSVGDGTNSASATVAISLLPYNDLRPSFTGGLNTGTRSIAENSAVGLSVYDVDATDGDQGTDGVITYMIVSGGGNKFSIDPSSGLVSVAANVESTPTYTIVVEAKDGGKTPGPLSAQFNVTVTITDVNDNAPICSNSLFTASIPEDFGTGGMVTNLNCFDTDASTPNNVIANYTVDGLGGEFLISATGVVTTTVSFNREAVASYTLVIVVRDNGTNPSVLSTTTTLVVTITDVNDNKPVFAQIIYNFNVAENITGYANVGKVSATDADTGLAASISYSISSGNNDGKFAIDQSTGDITLITTLNYESVTTYTLVLHAVDKQATFQTGTATVSIHVTDVNDMAPSCPSSLYTSSVAENTPATISVLTVSCTDADSTVGNTVTYSITSGGAIFTVDQGTGILSTNSALDMETTQSYDVVVRATDGLHNMDVTVKISVTNINDKTPAFSPTGPYFVPINENIAIGSTIYDLNATDADFGETNFIFSISGDTSGGKFVIGASSGIIQTSKAIDRDTPLVPSYILNVTVADGIGAHALTATTSIVITINDENDNSPSCDAAVYTVTALEAASIGTNFISPVCSDIDVVASPTLLFSIASGNDEDKFVINGGNGKVSLKNSLDYETTTKYTLTVHVSDQGALAPHVQTLTMVIYVDPVNESPPVFQGEPYSATVDEDENSGYLVVIISANDDDKGSNHGGVQYAIKSGNDDGRFSINPRSGQIIVAGPLDREAKSAYALTVTAADMHEGDAAARTAETTFTVTINDVNDNYPEINPSSYTGVVDENANIGASIIKIIASDADYGPAGSNGLQYSITGTGNTNNAFSMSGAWVTLAGTVDASTKSLYMLTVKVSDQGSPVRSALTRVTIQVVSVNEHQPLFTTATEVTISESTPVGSSIDRLAASDGDTGVYGVLRYYFQSAIMGNANDFTVDLFDGTIRVAHALDYDLGPKMYKIEIKVEDTSVSSSQTKSSSITYTINLADENDQTPQFSQNTYTVNVNENLVNPSLIGLFVFASDTDSGVNGEIMYTIVAGSGKDVFSIDSTNGAISTKSEIDYETQTSYDIIIEAKDSGVTKKLSSTCVVRIQVMDLNDNTPKFQAGNVSIAIPEDTSVGTTIANPGATDKDSVANNNNVITYAFSAISDKFSIDPSTGVITVTNKLDRETVPSYILIIHAKDSGSNPQQNTGTATYTVILTDVNNKYPIVNQTLPLKATIAEDTSLNFIVFNVSATDLDRAENALLTYRITNGNMGDHFRIEPGLGIIQVNHALDRETQDMYELEITITDSGAVPLSVITTATVTLSDVNDNPPVFQPAPITTYRFSVSENVPRGSNVNNVSATDADINANGQIQYIIAYHVSGEASHFSLDVGTGVIKTAHELDREVRDLYVFVVRATDSGTNRLSSTVTVSVTISDFNDNLPTFNKALYTANVLENDPVGTSILTMVLQDEDIDINADLTLTIGDAIADQYIAANSSTFVLSVKQPIDRETINLFNFTLTVTDRGTPPLSFQTRVVITVNDVNDNPPVFSPIFYNSEIAHTDECQVTVAVLTASDKDSGVHAGFTYAMNSYPQIFSLNSVTGVVTKTSTATANFAYKLYVEATDQGLPPQTTVNKATVRVDTYDPASVILAYYMDISETVYRGMELTFLSQLTTLYRVTYPTSQAKRWCIKDQPTSSSGIVVHVYVVKDNTSDELSEINNPKVFLTADQAFKVTAADESGTPSDSIKGVGWAAFSIVQVKKYVEPEVETTSWISTTAGIVTVSVIVVVIVAVAVAIVVYVCYRIRHPSVNQVNDSQEGDDSMPAKNQFDNKNNTLQTQNNRSVFSYDKSHPPPAVMSLPTPASTKRVPQQIQNRSEAERPMKDINLQKEINGGPMLVKQPEKLRADIPDQMEPFEAPPPRRLPPIYQAPLPRVPLPDESPQPSPRGSDSRDVMETPTDTRNYMVINREFDGRAIDPVSGRLYEYNTRTNERRWVHTPEGHDVKLTRDED